jgi:hypothetical protein
MGKCPQILTKLIVCNLTSYQWRYLSKKFFITVHSIEISSVFNFTIICLDEARKVDLPRLGSGRPTNHYSIPGMGKSFSLLLVVETSTGAHPDSYAFSKDGFTGGKAGGCAADDCSTYCRGAREDVYQVLGISELHSVHGKTCIMCLEFYTNVKVSVMNTLQT